MQQAELYYTWSLRIRERLGDVAKAEDAKKRLSVLLTTDTVEKVE